MPVQMIASFSALMTRISEGTKFTHICLVYFQDEIQLKEQRIMKLYKQEETKDNEQYLSKKSEERKQTNSPQSQNVYCTSHSNRIE